MILINATDRRLRKIDFPNVFKVTFINLNDQNTKRDDVSQKFVLPLLMSGCLNAMLERLSWFHNILLAGISRSYGNGAGHGKKF